MAELGQSIKQYLRKYHLDEYSCINWNVESVVFSFAGSMADIENCVRQALRELSEPGANEVQISVREISFQEFSHNFLLLGMIVVPCNSADDLSRMSKQMFGAKQMPWHFRNSKLKVFATDIQYGYCDGGVFVFFSEPTQEIVVVAFYGSD